MTHRVSRLILLLAVLLVPPLHADPAWVADELRLNLYPEPDENSEPIRVLSSGDLLETLDESEDGFVRVETSDGTAGWVDSGFLMEEPPARVRIESVADERDELAGEVTAQRETIDQLQSRVAELEEERDELAARAASRGQASSELEQRIASLEAERDRLSGTLAERDDRIEDLQAELEDLRDGGDSITDIAVLAQPVLFPGEAADTAATVPEESDEGDEETAAPPRPAAAALPLWTLPVAAGLLLLAAGLGAVLGYRLRERRIRQRLGGLSL